MSEKLGMEYTTRNGLGVQESKGVKSNQWKHQSPKLLYLMLCHGKSGTFSWATSAWPGVLWHEDPRHPEKPERSCFWHMLKTFAPSVVRGLGQERNSCGIHSTWGGSKLKTQT